MAKQNTQALIEKIQSPPADRIAEVEDFVDFLRQKTKQSKTTASNKVG